MEVRHTLTNINSVLFASKLYLRLRLPILQEVENDRDLLRQDVLIYAERPQKDIHSFIGTLIKVRFKLDDI